jgi:hypothetical protein
MAGHFQADLVRAIELGKEDVPSVLEEIPGKKRSKINCHKGFT